MLEAAKIGPYRVLSKVSEGGMGTVYLAQHEQKLQSSPLALKVIRKQLGAGSLQDLVLWRRELEALSGMNHPNIVQVRDFGETEEAFYLALEYVHGQTIKAFQREAPVSLRTALDIALQVVGALRYAHARNVIHLDLKPQNILVEEKQDGLAVKILDFGLARFLMDPGPKDAGAASGTLGYMAPEQLSGPASALGVHTDLYAVGVLLAELLLGFTPFDVSRPLASRSPEAVARLLGRLDAPLPDGVTAVLGHLLEPEIERRYQSADGLLYDLKACLRHLAADEGADFELEVGSRDHRPTSAVDVAFVGRCSELAVLADLLEEARHGRPRVAFVSGPPGMGKSRLAAEFARRAGEEPLVLGGKATRNTRNVPYYPLLAAVSEYLERTLPEGWRVPAREEAARRSELYELLRLLSGGASTVPQPDIEHGKERFLRLLVTKIVASCSRSHPLLLVLDDLQWADPATLELVGRIARSPEGCLFVLGLFRDEESDPRQHLGRLLVDLGDRAEHFHLPRLRTDEMVALAADLMGGDAGQMSELGQLLQDHGGGVPFNALALTASLVEEGVLLREHQNWRLDEARRQEFFSAGKQTRLVEAMVEGLSADLVSMLEWCSVLGTEFAASLVAELTDAAPEEVRPPLQAACAHGLLRAEGPGRYRFTHDQFRDFVYERIGEQERRRRHQRVAEVLEAGAADARTVLDLAEHYARGTNVEKALHYAVEAAQIAAAAYAYQSAGRYCRNALLMLRVSRQPAVELVESRKLARKILGDSMAATGEYDAALEQYGVAQELATRPEERAELLGRLAGVYVMKGELETAARLMEEALGILGVPLPTTRARTLASVLGSAARMSLPSRPLPAGQEASFADRLRMGILYRLVFTYFFFNLEKALAVQLIGMRISDRAPLCTERIGVRAVHAPIICGVPLRKRAVRVANETLRDARRLGDQGAIMTAAFYAGISHFFVGLWDEAVGLLRTAVGLFEETGDVFTLEMSHENLGFICHERGDFSNAKSHLTRALGLAQEVGDARGVAVTRLYLARVMLAEGELALAEENVDAAVAVLERVNDHAVEAAVRRTEASVRYAAGRLEEGREALERSLYLVEEHKLAMEYVGPVFYMGVEMLLGSRSRFDALNREEQRQLLKRAAGMVRQAASFARRFPGQKGPALRAHGLYLLRRGKVAAARRILSRSVQALNEMGMRYELALSYRVWAETFPEDDPARTGALALAQGIFDETGVAPAWMAGLDPVPETEGIAASTRRAPSSSQRSRGREGAELRSLLEVGKVLSATLDLDELFERIMDAVMEVTGAERGALLMRDEADDLNVAVRRPTAPSGEEVPEFASRSIIDMVLRTGEPVLLSDAMHDPRLATSPSVYRHRIRSALCFPLVVKGRPEGVIYLENNRVSNLFGQPHLEVIQLFAAQASVALANGIAYREIEALNRALEAKVAERTQELEDAGRDLEGKNRELSRTIRELKDTRDRMVQQGKMATLGEMAAGATHEINNPLNFMRAGAFAIRKKCTVLQGLLEAHEMPSEHGDRLSEIVELSDVVANGCQRIQGITEGLMRASQQRGGRAETLDLNDVARETVQLVQGSKPSGINLRCEVAPLPSVWGNRSQLNQVLLNLVLNAFDAVENKGTVTVRTRSAGESVEMEVQDDGPGIAPEHLKRVFEPFFTTKELNRGRGLGLSICMQIVQQHDGSMCVRSEPGKGALFTVSLPTLRSLGPRPDGSKINGTAHDSHR